MTTPLYLSLVFHNHQPVGQFDYVTEHSTNVSYVPLVELLERHPTIHVSLHFSGVLLAWLKANHSSLIERLKQLVQAGQVELLTGGYFEPILVALPDEDKIGQVQKLTIELKDTFGYSATGLWLAERVWEPYLARPLAQAGIKYVMVDDTHFEAVGYNAATDLFGYYLTEEQGETVAVVPSLRYLRSMIPWQPIPTLIEWLRLVAKGGTSSHIPRIAFMGDDGEKFGRWSGSYEHCWGDAKYMEQLFSTLEKQSNWLKTTTPGEFMRRHPALGRVYIPAASSTEMDEWSLPAEASHSLGDLRRTFEVQQRQDITRFMNGGLWRNFLVKYAEANQMHKRALAVSKAVHDMRRGRRRDEALDMLWAGQGNDPYWHGIDGGLYLFNCRIANYANLISAESMAAGDEVNFQLRSADFDRDGRDEIIMLGWPYHAIWTPALGGALTELDFRPAQYNLLNVVSRYKEAYHADLQAAAREKRIITPDSSGGEYGATTNRLLRAKEQGLEHLVIHDWHRRASYIDHFLDSNTTLSEFYHAQYAEQGDFVNLAYRPHLWSTAKSAQVTLLRDGHVWLKEAQYPITVQKLFAFEKGSETLDATYTLSHPGAQTLTIRFGVELVLGFDGGQDAHYCALYVNDDARALSLGDVAEVKAVTSFRALTSIRNLTVDTHISQPAVLWRFPLEAITLSEAGFERGYQGTVFMTLWEVALKPGEPWSVTISQSTTHTQPPDLHSPQPSSSSKGFLARRLS